MRPLTSRVALTALFLSGGLGCDEREDTRESTAPVDSKPMKEVDESRGADLRKAQQALPAIIFLGDSLTAGYGLSAEDAFPAFIEQRLRERGKKYQVINAGRSGDTTAGGLSRLDWYLKERVNPRVLVIFLGSNDAMRGVPLATMEQNLRAIVDKARAFRPDLSVFLVELRTFPNMGMDYGEEFQQLFSRVAKDKNVALIEFPLLEVAGRPELNQADGVHPNEVGTRKVAEGIWKGLEGEL